MKALRIRHVLASIMEHRIVNKCRRDVCNPIPSAFILGGESWLSGKFI